MRPLRRDRNDAALSLSPLSLRTLYYHPLQPPLFLSLSRRSSLSGGRPWYLRANRPVVRIEITSNSLIDIASGYKEIDSPERIFAANEDTMDELHLIISIYL